MLVGRVKAPLRNACNGKYPQSHAPKKNQQQHKKVCDAKTKPMIIRRQRQPQAISDQNGADYVPNPSSTGKVLERITLKLTEVTGFEFVSDGHVCGELRRQTSSSQRIVHLIRLVRNVCPRAVSASIIHLFPCPPFWQARNTIGIALVQRMIVAPGKKRADVELHVLARAEQLPR